MRSQPLKRRPVRRPYVRVLGCAATAAVLIGLLAVGVVANVRHEKQEPWAIVHVPTHTDDSGEELCAVWIKDTKRDMLLIRTDLVIQVSSEVARKFDDAFASAHAGCARTRPPGLNVAEACPPARFASTNTLIRIDGRAPFYTPMAEKSLHLSDRDPGLFDIIAAGHKLEYSGSFTGDDDVQFPFSATIDLSDVGSAIKAWREQCSGPQHPRVGRGGPSPSLKAVGPVSSTEISGLERRGQ